VTALQQRRLGRTELMVTELGLGGYQFTSEFGVSRETAIEAIATAFDAGINLVDTAPMYGSGESEERVGAVIGGRPEVRISNKVGYLDRTVARDLGDAGYRDGAALRRVVEHSLEVLGRDHLDLLLIHEPEWPQWGIDPHTGHAPVTTALESMRAEGLTRGIGLGGQDLDLTISLVATGRFDVALSVMHYDLAVWDARDSLLPVAQQNDVGIILGTPLRQGLLAKRHPDPEAAMFADAERPAGERRALARRLTAIYDLADDLGVPVPALALRFLLADDRVSSIIPGARSAADVRANVATALAGPLDPSMVARVLEL
jgi:aryl-alcohol dehydrogenase-like predicted oxidoreductase